MFLIWAFATMTAEEILYQINSNKNERGAVAARQQQLQTALEEVRASKARAQDCLDACRDIKKGLERSLDDNESANGFTGNIKKDLIESKGQAAIDETNNLIGAMDARMDALTDLENTLTDEIRGSETMLRKVANWLDDAWYWYKKLTN